jgi:hypothetical protein
MKASRSPSSTAAVGDLDPGAQVLHQLIGLQHVGADLVAPADVGLRRPPPLGRLVALLQLALVEPRLQHVPGLGAVLVLRALVLARDDAGRHVGDAHRRIGGVDVLAAGARGAVGVDAAVASLTSMSMVSSTTG